MYGRPVSPLALDYLLQPYLPGVNSAAVLKRPFNMQFARKEGGQYYLHPVDRAYALARIPQEPLIPAGLSQREKTLTPTLYDLDPQLAEIELHGAAGEYDTAAEVLLEIDFDYLLLWGYYRLMIALHESLQGKLSDPDLKTNSVGNLGSAYYSIGQAQPAIACYEAALEMVRKAENRQAEGALLGNLGNAYGALGQTVRAIAYYEQALAIRREIGDRQGESIDLNNIGHALLDLGKLDAAIQSFQKAIQIADEIGFVLEQNYAR